ncbi:MAG: tol-pal system protein YbgF [Geobacteraceae bacterium GWC2_53_11]|nr:MAG: tol-pal system protein YbgF [Geobacteraceae bacterium GWC2_53_11]
MLSGCAANDLVVKRQAESEAKIEYLVQSSKKTEQRQNEFDGQIRAQDERFQSVTGELKRLKDENRELRTSNDELKVRVAAVAKQMQTPKVEIVNQPSPVKSPRESGPPAEYLKAFGLYSANNFPAAVDSFEAFLKNNPQSDYAANAQYWIGECHYTLSDLPKAKDAFSKVAEMYPKSSKTPDALLKLGFTLSAMQEKDKAAAVFEKIVTLYPSSPAAAKARERLSAH